jgi:hypothetical protein
MISPTEFFLGSAGGQSHPTAASSAAAAPGSIRPPAQPLSEPTYRDRTFIERAAGIFRRPDAV